MSISILSSSHASGVFARGDWEGGEIRQLVCGVHVRLSVVPWGVFVVNFTIMIKPLMLHLNTYN